jgi:hypothetical protein
MIVTVSLGWTLLPFQGQAQSQNVEQQLRSQYRVTRVGTNGTVVGQAGTILIVEQDGLNAIPASYGKYWYSNFKAGGRIKGSAIQHGGTVAIAELRSLQVGEKAYLADLEINQAEMVFYLQSCGACDVSAPDSNDVPYRARLAIGFQKGYLSTSTSKQIQDTIGQVFAVDAGVSGPGPKVPPGPPPGPGPVPPAPAPLRLPATYANAQASADQLQLNADNSFSLQEAGQAYHGTFVVSGNTLELSFSDPNIPKNTAKLQGNNLTDSSGQTWVLREQRAGTAPDGSTLQNEDVIKMVKAGRNDVFIIARINGSNCQFDTSTDALIRLKQNGVSSAVLKAMIGAGK